MDILIFDLEKIVISYMNIICDEYILELFPDEKQKNNVYKYWIQNSRIIERKTKFNSKTYVNYALHSIFDQPTIIWNDGYKQWYKNNTLYKIARGTEIIYV